MTDFYGFFKKFFDGKKQESSKIPFLHEPIDLKSFPEDKVDLWLVEGDFRNISELITSAFRDYYITDRNQNTSQSVSILDSSHSSGWFLKCDQLNFLDQDFKYLAFDLSMKLKKVGYVIQLAELKSIAKSSGIELTTHYYLKPSLKNRFSGNQDKANQLYGNVTIEYKTINGIPQSFKFLAKAYSDSKFLPPQEFSELNQILLGL